MRWGDVSEQAEDHRRHDILVILRDAAHRATLQAACRAAGLSVVGVSSIPEIVKWPAGQIVVTDAAHVTPFWRSVGAVEVLVLAANAGEAIAALAAGATQWMRVTEHPDAVAARVRRLATRNAGDHTTLHERRRGASDRRRRTRTDRRID